MGFKSIHGIMPISIPKASAAAIASLKLYLDQLTYQIPADEMNRIGTATGELVGGNLSILYSLLGSPSAIDCKDKILFIEDLDEYLYHIDDA
jgi:muramoyltetrapeptide carboxypeptidase